MSQEKVFITISADPDNYVELAHELSRNLHENGNVYVSVPRFEAGRRSAGLALAEIAVALGSAGAFTALFQVLSKYFERNRDRQLTLERGKSKIMIKGHTLPEETALLAALLPDARAANDSPKLEEAPPS